MEEEKKLVTLEEGEEILWQAGAKPFRTLDKTNKPGFLLKAIIGAAIFIGVLIGYLATVGDPSEIKPILCLIVLLFCALPSINTFSDAKSVRKVRYLATNRRLIAVRDTGRSIDYGAIREAAFRTDADGNESLLCGRAAVKAKSAKWRALAVTGATPLDENGVCESFAFYAPEDIDGLKKVLKDVMPAIFGE